MRVLILGCGYTGTILARQLAQQGVPVSITNRSGELPPELASFAIPCYPFGSQANGAITPIPFSALAAITHVLSSIPPLSSGQDLVLSHLLPELLSLNLAWFGYLSTTGVYGDCQGAWVEETRPVNPQNARSSHRVHAETGFRNSGLPAHIFRLSGIYGPGPGRNIFERLRSGKAQHITRPGHVFSRVHVDDIVQTLWRSMTTPRPGEIYNVSDDLPTESSHLILEACSLMGVTPPPAIPWEDAYLSPMAASFWQESRRVSNFKIKSQLGVELFFPTYKQGLVSIYNAYSTEKSI